MDKQRVDERRTARAKVLLSASIEWEGARTPVKVANLSAHGALLHGERLPEAAGTPITFRCGELVVAAWIAWIRTPYVGIDFDETIAPEAMLWKPETAPAAVIKDLRTVNFRRPGFRGRQLSKEERQLIESWTREDRVGL